MPKIDPRRIPELTGTNYPDEFKHVCAGRIKQRLGDAVGLTQFGVNLTRLKPGAASALRHWHVHEDEFIYVIDGELVLIEDQGETILKSGDMAGFKAGIQDAHCVVNRTQQDAVYLEIGTRAPVEHAEYPDVDLMVDKDENGFRYSRRDGTPYRPR